MAYTDWNSGLFLPDSMYGPIPGAENLAPVGNVASTAQLPLELRDALDVMKTHADICKNIDFKNSLEKTQQVAGMTMQNVIKRKLDETFDLEDIQLSSSNTGFKKSKSKKACAKLSINSAEDADVENPNMI